MLIFNLLPLVDFGLLLSEHTEKSLKVRDGKAKAR